MAKARSATSIVSRPCSRLEAEGDGALTQDERRRVVAEAGGVDAEGDAEAAVLAFAVLPNRRRLDAVGRNENIGAAGVELAEVLGRELRGGHVATRGLDLLGVESVAGLVDRELLGVPAFVALVLALGLVEKLREEIDALRGADEDGPAAPVGECRPEDFTPDAGLDVGHFVDDDAVEAEASEASALSAPKRRMLAPFGKMTFNSLSRISVPGICMASFFKRSHATALACSRNGAMYAKRPSGVLRAPRKPRFSSPRRSSLTAKTVFPARLWRTRTEKRARSRWTFACHLRGRYFRSMRAMLNESPSRTRLRRERGERARDTSAAGRRCG
jgi:hypothetical protein